jgi:hypothetical protein
MAGMMTIRIPTSMWRIPQPCRQPINLRFSDVAETDAASFAFCAIFDRSCLDPQDFPNERRKTRWRPALLSPITPAAFAISGITLPSERPVSDFGLQGGEIFQ